MGTAKVREGDLLLASLVFFSFSEPVLAGAGCPFTEIVGDKGCVLTGVAGVIFNSAAAYDFPVGKTGDAFAVLGDLCSFCSSPFTSAEGLGVSLDSGKSCKYR
jgi:hypothetical protein